MFRKLNKREEGFTIIEVLIVLAIAGLIMLVVFLAVPALQRNSRNTQRKADASALLAALSESVSNNSGSLPNTCDGTANTCFVREAKLSFFDNTTANVTYTRRAQVVQVPPQLAVGNTVDRDRVLIYNGVKCAGGDLTITNASLRSTAIQFLIENNSGYVRQCIES